MTPQCPTAFATQLLEQLPSLRRRARVLSLSHADAEDLVSDTVLRAMSHYTQFEVGTNLRAWLLRILYHAFASRHRKAKREARALQRFAFEPSGGDCMSHVQCATELPERIKRALGVLPDRMAAVVKLVDIDELSYREASESLNVPVGTVMSRLYRGRQRLAIELSLTKPSNQLVRNGCAAA